MAALNPTYCSAILNCTLPTATGRIGTVLTNVNMGISTGGAMRINLTSTTNVAGAGTELANGSGYTTHGIPFGVVVAAATNVPPYTSTLPAAGDASTFLWTNSSGGWTIYGLNIIDFSNVQIWYGNFNGAPITVAALNSFQIAQSAIQVTLQ